MIVSKMKNLYFLGLVFVLMSCENEVVDIESFEIGETITFDFGKPRINQEYGFSIVFDTLISDSRCPLDVNCIWGGIGIIGMTISYDDEVSKIILSTYDLDEYNQSIELFGITYKLVELVPYPDTRITHQIEDYQAVVLIENE